MASGGLITIGPQQPIPPGQVEAEIAVSFADHDRMMDAMHIRGYHQPPQISVQSKWQADIAVIEHRGRVQQDLKREYRERRRSQRSNRAQLDQHRQTDLDRMKASSRGHIEV